jgi:hypothetical protein
MAADLKKAVNNALAALPSREEVRQRIAENLQERQLLRRVLKLIEQREQAAALSKTGGQPR